MSPCQHASRPIATIGMAGDSVTTECRAVQATHRNQVRQVSHGQAGSGQERPQGTRRPATDPHDEMSSSDARSTVADTIRSAVPMRDHPGQEPAWPVLGYASIGPAPLEHSSGDLRRRAREIAAECDLRGLFLVEVVHDHAPPRHRPLDRPGLGYALGQIAAEEARGLVVSELSQLSPALPDLGQVLEWLTRHDARVIAVAPRIDTAEEGGRLAIRTIIEVSRWERERLAERTRAGMRAARRKGPARVSDDPALQERIAGMRASGMTLQAIADRLNADGIPTLRGGAMWRPSSVQAAAGYRRPSTAQGAEQDHGAEGAWTDNTDDDAYRAAME